MGDEASGGATISGWGTLAPGGDIADVLQYASVPVLDNTVCTEDGSPFEPENIKDSMLCSAGGVQTCLGDAGAPLLQSDLLIGTVTSFYSCDFEGYPAVYTKTSSFVDWIEDNTF